MWQPNSLFFFQMIQAIAEGEEKGNFFDICEKRLLTDIAVVEIYFGSPFITKLKRDVQTTFTGKISNIGTGNAHYLIDVKGNITVPSTS